jgi:hypothetical protein
VLLLCKSEDPNLDSNWRSAILTEGFGEFSHFLEREYWGKEGITYYAILYTRSGVAQSV